MEVFVVCKLGVAVLILAFTQLQLSALDRRFARDNSLLKSWVYFVENSKNAIDPPTQ